MLSRSSLKKFRKKRREFILILPLQPVTLAGKTLKKPGNYTGTGHSIPNLKLRSLYYLVIMAGIGKKCRAPFRLKARILKNNSSVSSYFNRLHHLIKN